jgi:TonB-dependent receptor-like protein/ABC transporter family protein
MAAETPSLNALEVFSLVVPERLHDVTLQLKAGRLVGLIGPNGSGKSTLLQVAGGLLGSSGTVSWSGRDLSSIPPMERGRRASWVPQDAHFEFGFSVRSVVAQGRFAHGDDDRGIEDALQKFDLLDLAERPVNRLSGGEKVRVMLARGTKLRATYGTGFSAPGSDDRYGVPEFGQLASPGLRPEKSRGWDAGIDHEILEGKGTLSATYFQNRFRDLFSYQYVDYVTFQGRTVNVARATTSGVELGAEGQFSEHWQARFAYTYLDAKDDLTQTRLPVRPRHLIDLEASWKSAAKWSIGAGLHGVVDRVEAAGPTEDYCTLRFFASYAVTRNLLLKVRVENALNEKYEEVFGYPALGRGVNGTVDWHF